MTRWKTLAALCALLLSLGLVSACEEEAVEPTPTVETPPEEPVAEDPANPAELGDVVEAPPEADIPAGEAEPDSPAEPEQAPAAE